MTWQPEVQRRVLVICTANIARSPLAGTVLEAHVQRRALSGRVVVTTAGVHARHGDAAADHSRDIVRRWGLDLDDHRSQPVGDDLLAASHLVVSMSQRQRDLCGGRGPGIAARSFTLPELVRLADHVDLAGLPDDTPARFDAAITALHRARPFSSGGGDDDVDDPYGRGLPRYVDMANRVAALLTVAADVLFGPAPGQD